MDRSFPAVSWTVPKYFLQISLYVDMTISFYFLTKRTAWWGNTTLQNHFGTFCDTLLALTVNLLDSTIKFTSTLWYTLGCSSKSSKNCSICSSTSNICPLISWNNRMKHLGYVSKSFRVVLDRRSMHRRCRLKLLAQRCISFVFSLMDTHRFYFLSRWLFYLLPTARGR